MDFPAQIIIWINTLANFLGKIVLAPIAMLPGWFSNTIISAVTGILLLILFKYTSNQRAIGRVRDDIKANMLAMKLFKEDVTVTLKSQARLFKGAALLLIHSIRPMLVMILPVFLLLAQLGLWYQSRPLLVGEEANVTVTLATNEITAMNSIVIEPNPAAEVILGPVKVLSEQQILWKIKASQQGQHHLVFKLNGRQFEKELVIGDGFMRVSNTRPGRRWTDILLHPWEKPFGPDSVVQSISIDYPERRSLTCGTNSWLIYFFAASLIFALIFKPFLKVRI